MNRYSYTREIETLRKAAELCDDMSITLRESVSDNRIEIEYAEREAAYLGLAADLIRRTLPQDLPMP